jgi:sugar phosphate isomerase/epimerase
MLREIRELGFEYAELSHGIRIALVQGILDGVNAGEIKISSLHNFCPLPMGINHAAPNVYKFTSADGRERENALRYSLKTLEFAARVKARVVVLHMGRIEMDDYTDKLAEMLEKGQGGGDEYAALCEKMLTARQRGRDRAVELAGQMLEKLADKAEELGLTLGIENREALHEIPLEAEFPAMLQEFDRPGVGYWHDTGHAQIKENLGFLNHAIHFETMAPRLVGMHIHDVVYPARDHSIPGTGTINFAALKPMIKPEHVKVFELHPALKPEEVKQGAAHIFELWGRE